MKVPNIAFHDAIGVFALVVFVVFVALALSIPVGIALKRNADYVPSLTSESDEPQEAWSLETVRHGGHWFVVGDRWGMHSPECPCRTSTAESTAGVR